MLYVIEYGCGCGSNEMVVEAENEEVAVRFAWEKACEDYDRFHNIVNWEYFIRDEIIIF